MIPLRNTQFRTQKFILTKIMSKNPYYEVAAELTFLIWGIKGFLISRFYPKNGSLGKKISKLKLCIKLVCCWDLFLKDDSISLLILIINN